MGNKFIDSTLLDKAITFAAKAHKNVERRGKGFPYIAHPLEAMSIVATMTNDQDLLAAACLHDVIEDTDITYEELKKEFNKRVADLVLAESDKEFPGMKEADSWIMRKQLAMEHLANSSKDVQMVALGDKLSNMRALYRDYRAIGDELWNRFHVTDPALHAWHYRGLRDALIGLKDTEAYKEFAYLVNRTFPDKYDGFVIREKDGVVLVKGFLDHEGAMLLKRYLAKDKETVLDFTDVYDANFSGFRGLLTLKYEGYNFMVRNASRKVFHRAYVTGINAIIPFLPAPREYNINKLEQSGDGYTAVSYFSKDGDAMAKLYYEFIDESEVEREKRYATSALLLGIPTPLCGDIIQIDGKKGVMFERIKDKKSFARALADNPENIDTLAKDFAEISKKLHNTKCDTNVFPSVKDVYLKYVDNFMDITDSEKSKIKSFILNSGDDVTCLHGDYHIGNAIITKDNEKLFIDMSDFSYGNKLFDLGTLWFICHADKDDTVVRLFHCSHELLNEFYHHFVKYYFGEDVNEEELDLLLRPYAALTVIHFANKGKQNPWMSFYVKDNLLNLIK